MKKDKFKKAYTLIEISGILIIIAIFMVGVYQGMNIFHETQISGAKSLTKSAPVMRTENVGLWYETTLDESIDKSEKNTGVKITKWFDINSQRVERFNAFAGQSGKSNHFSFDPNPLLVASGPEYQEKAINGLPGLKFTNSQNVSQFLVIDPNFKINDDDFSIFIVIQFINASIHGSILDRVCLDSALKPIASSVEAINSCNPSIIIKSSLPNQFYSTLSNDDATKVYNSQDQVFNKDRPYILGISRWYNQFFMFDINSKNITKIAEDAGKINFLPFKIGRHAFLSSANSEFYISEIIIINGKLKEANKKLIEKYLSKKYNIPINE